MKKLMIMWLVCVLLVPMPAQAAGRKVAGAVLAVAGAGLIAGAFDWSTQCPPGYSTHTFQNLPTQCVFISSRGSDVQEATTKLSFERPALVWAGAATAVTGVVLLLLPKKVAKTVQLSVAPSRVSASKTFGF